MTIWHCGNYGAEMQTYATVKALRKLGHDVEVIDYKYPNEFHWRRGLLWGKPQKKNLKNFLK